MDENGTLCRVTWINLSWFNHILKTVHSCSELQEGQGRISLLSNSLRSHIRRRVSIYSKWPDRRAFPRGISRANTSRRASRRPSTTSVRLALYLVIMKIAVAKGVERSERTTLMNRGCRKPRGDFLSKKRKRKNVKKWLAIHHLFFFSLNTHTFFWFLSFFISIIKLWR